jgi:hypothetical protein
MTIPSEIPEDAEELFEVADDGSVIPVIRYEGEDEPIHSVEYPYCGDPSCICGGSPAASN